MSAPQVYRPPRPPQPIDLRLDANEGAAPSVAASRLDDSALPELIRRYPDDGPLTEALASRLGLDPRQVLVTAGADDAIERVLRAFAAPGREVIVPQPTFGMISRYVEGCGARLVPVPWIEGPWPIDAVLERLGPRTAVIVVVTPNNPTGATASAEALDRLARAAPRAVLLVDLAYVEYAETDLTARALEWPNAVVCRTFSKARGLAGLRVGWAAGPTGVIEALRRVGHPFACSSLSLALARAALEPERAPALAAHVEQVRDERRALTVALGELGCKVLPSEANFLLVRPPQPGGARWLWEGLAGLGIAVRRFADPQLEPWIRITLPGDRAAFARLLEACATVLRPEALLLDLDDTLIDTSRSFRRAIVEAAAHFGVRLDEEEICRAKAAGGANDEWVLAGEMLAARGVHPEPEAITEVCEALYRGRGGGPALADLESPLVDPARLERLARRLPLGLVTGREHRDARGALERWGLAPAFTTLVGADEAPTKPSPAPLRLALERLGARRAWMVGDSPQDIAAARAAGVLPIGVIAPGAPPEGTRSALLAAGAARVIDGVDELERMLP
ncbi:MAG TPA: aminotransferase class I/II-fold pyridoxal phosphate-dependent enzyme [Acidobacteria bacterium]|nr:aminotransferase class I/II-fold pyridoxal phosphate-dependent enzyme [Acidobacteriota bacterium]